MAHYIIDDRGFGGTWYECSNCGALFWDISDEVDHFECLKCGAEINPDENVYE